MNRLVKKYYFLKTINSINFKKIECLKNESNKNINLFTSSRRYTVLFTPLNLRVGTGHSYYM